MRYVFAIYDSAASYYLSPFVVDNIGVAMREFNDACNNKETFLYKHPGDFTLFRLGTFDECTGEFILEKTPVRMGVAIEFKKNDAVKQHDEVYHADNIKVS